MLVLSPADHTVSLLTRYVFALARYDHDYDVRDRGRMLGALLAGVRADVYGDGDSTPDALGGVVLRREQVKMVLFEGKASPAQDTAASDGAPSFFSYNLIDVHAMRLLRR